MADYLKKIKIFLLIIIFGILSIFLPSFLLRSGEIDLSYKYLYLVILIAYFLMFFILDRLIDIKKFAFLLSLPLLILTIYGLKINFNHLYPSFFPAVNIIFLGAISPFLFRTNRVKTFIPIFLLLTCFSILGYSKIQVNHRLQKTHETLNNFKSINLKDSKNNFFKLNEHSSFIIDFMFTKCTPCINKLENLAEVANNNIKVYIIIDGNIDSFNSFKSFQKTYNEKFKNLAFLYDSNGIFTKNLSVKKYPTEFLIKNGIIVGKEFGFTEYDKKDYLNSRISSLK